MNKCVCCGKTVGISFYICASCEKEYEIAGKPKSEWPKWLLFLVQDSDKENKKEIRGIDEFETTFSDLGWNDDIIEDDEESYSGESIDDPWEAIDAKLDAELDIKKLKKELSPKEEQILNLIAKGYNYEEISQKMDLSPRTISYYHSNIKKIAIRLGIYL